MAEKLMTIRSLDRWTGPLLTTGVLLLLGLIALLEFETFREFRHLDDQMRKQRESLGDLADVRGLGRAMADMESGVRGYAITGRDSFLAPYHAGRAQFGRLASRLSARSGAVAEQAEPLRRIEAIEADWRTNFAEPIVRRRREASSPAAAGAILAEMSQGAGGRRVDAIRAQLEALEEQLTARIRAASVDIDRGSEEARRFAVRTGLAILLAIAFMAAVIARGFRTAAERNVELVRQVREREEAERRAQASEARFQAFLNGLADAIVITELDGTIVWGNPALESLSGYPIDVLQGSPLSRLSAEESPVPLPALLDRLRGGEPHATIEVTARRADASEFPAEVAVSLFEAPSGPRLGLLVRDISERKENERMKSVFIASVSHELRTPLTSIMGSLALLREGEAGELPGPARSFVAMAHDNCIRLSRLVDDVIDNERISSGALAFRIARHPLPTLLREAVVLNQGYARTHDVFFFLDEPVPPVAIDVDRDRLLQAVTNLLSNAAKFSPPGEEVHVGASLAGERVRLSVTDRGPGIPEAFRRRIFEKFAQADDSDSREKGGTGLGLAIAHAIVVRLGGEIGFDTAVGRGTTFWIELPVASRLQAEGSAPPARA
jgi:PAS domain S-box-containing protein